MPWFSKIKCFKAAAFFWVGFTVLSSLAPGAARALGGDEKIAVLVSMAIRPYLDAVEGIEDVVSGQSDLSLEMFILEDFDAAALSNLADRLDQQNYRIRIAVGPEAARFLWTEAGGGPAVMRFYSMVLNPESIVQKEERYCGIALNIPIKDQILEIVRHLPSVRRLGLMFDPSHNAFFSSDSQAIARDFGLEILPLPVSSTTQIQAVLEAAWKRMDGLWLIPDRTVISEGLVRHITKAAIANRVAVIGYNRFFLESGAALAMVLDYRGIGRQTAVMCLERVVEGKPCQARSPAFETVFDERVLKKMGIGARSGDFPRAKDDE